jgi:hypothetical protein
MRNQLGFSEERIGGLKNVEFCQRLDVGMRFAARLMVLPHGLIDPRRLRARGAGKRAARSPFDDSDGSRFLESSLKKVMWPGNLCGHFKFGFLLQGDDGRMHLRKVPRAMVKLD